MKAPEILREVLGDVWTHDCLVRHGLPNGTVTLESGEGGATPTLVVMDQWGATWQEIAPLACTSTYAAYFDGLVVELIQRHNNPYNRYPQTTAPCELDYFA